MMKYTWTLIFTLPTFGAVFAQPNATVPKNIRAQSTLEQMFDQDGFSTSEILYGIPLEPGAVLGDTYLNEDWKRATFMLYDTEKLIEGHPAKLEISQNMFEIHTASGVKVLNGKRVKSFVWADEVSRAPHYFVNGADYKDEEELPFVGFFEVLTEGRYALLSKTVVSIREPTYNEKLDVGNRDTRIVKKEKLYYLDGTVARELPGSRKKLAAIFGEHADAMAEFIKTKKLSAKDPADVRAIFQQYERITGG